MRTYKLFLAAILVLALMAALSPGAFADVIYPAPAPVPAGSWFEHKVATISPGVDVSVMEESLPAGVQLSAEPGTDGQDVFLRGSPLYAGNYTCVFSVGGTNLSCPLSVEPAYPLILGTSSDVSCSVGDPVQLEVSAYSPDSGTLSYQWYLGQVGSGAPIGGNSPTLSVGTTLPGVTYYYCVVSNTNNGLTATCASPVVTVNVANAAGPSWISVYSEPFKTSYALGEVLDPSGLQLNVGYSDGHSEVIFTGYSVDTLPLTTPGVQTVYVYYGGCSCTFNVTVSQQAALLTGIGVLTPPSRTRYTVGEMLDTTGLMVRAYYSNAAVPYQDITAPYLSCSPNALNTTGEQEILVAYGDKTCSFTVTVEEAEHPVSLTVHQMPERVNYTVGQRLDITGLVLKQISSRQNTQLIYTGYSCSPTQLNTVGRQQITVYYGDLTTTFTVTVASASASPTVSASPVPTVMPSSALAGAPTPVPSGTPTASPSPSPSPLPTVSPTSAVRTSPRNAGHQDSLGRSLIGVIVITALVALAVLGVYVFVMNQGGFEGAEERLRELLGRNKGGKGRGGKH